jgi:DNA-directed RNA polymerase subunit RPC12/RpoP
MREGTLRVLRATEHRTHLPLPDCQRASGNAFAAVGIVANDRVTLKGETLKYSSVKAESGRTMQRGFCSECGSPIFIKRPETPLVQFIQAASYADREHSPQCAKCGHRVLLLGIRSIHLLRSTRRGRGAR